MNRFRSTILISLFLLIIFISLPSLVHAQLGDPGCDPLDPDCPIDGGLGLLLAAGVGYGIKKFRFPHKKEASEL